MNKPQSEQWAELDIELYTKLLAECKTDAEFRKRLKEMSARIAAPPKSDR